MRRRTVKRLLACVTIFVLVSGTWSTSAGVAADFAAPVFRFQWESAEANQPNFFGPLSNASAGTQEAYAEATGGQRLVQYFDKARMELAGPNTVTNGLLTVELKTGKMQTGNSTFEQRLPATIIIAGDPGQPGPTYADLAKLPERAPQTPTSLTTTWTKGDFVQSNVVPTDPNLTLTQYLTDPGGRYGQYVPNAFWNYLNALPLPWQSVLGFPISPAFGAQLSVGGTARPVFIQAFERRVLTYTPGNPPGFTVEFGNIGQHYYLWRYGKPIVPTASTASPPAPATVVTPSPPSASGPPSADTLFTTALAAFSAKQSAVLPLGNPTGSAYDETFSIERFESGTMYYIKSTGMIYVLSKTGVQLLSYPLTWHDGDPNGDLTPGPRPNTWIPRRGFGKVWRENAVVQQALGYATADERSYTGTFQYFERGMLIDDPDDGTVWALNVYANVWDSNPR